VEIVLVWQEGKDLEGGIRHSFEGTTRHFRGHNKQTITTLVGIADAIRPRFEVGDRRTESVHSTESAPN
jgi:hypothetical protein